jgi:endoglycosylceramidase
MNTYVPFALGLLAYLVGIPIVRFIWRFFGFPRKGENKYFIDKEGRIQIFHGVNICNSAKWVDDRLPWHSDREYQMLKDHGFNIVRFLIFWEAIEPEQGKFNMEYIVKVKEHISKLNGLGITVLLDLHQDVYNKKFLGNGFPDWTLPKEEYPFKPQKTWYMNYFQKPVRESYKHFWGSEELKMSYIVMLMFVHDQFSDMPNVIGVDVMNEPFPPLPFFLNFEKGTLREFYQEIFFLTVSRDNKIPFFFEPAIQTSAGIPSDLIGLDRAITWKKYIPHYYPPLSHYNGTYSKLAKLLMTIALRAKAREAQVIKSPYIIGEVGVCKPVKNRFVFIEDFSNQADKLHMSWTWWSYDKEGHDPQGLLDNEGNPNEFMEALTRPYPHKIAGTDPVYYIEGDRFYMEYYSDMSIKAPTEIYIPGEIASILSNTTWEDTGSGVRKFFAKEKGKQTIEIIYGNK